VSGDRGQKIHQSPITHHRLYAHHRSSITELRLPSRPAPRWVGAIGRELEVNAPYAAIDIGSNTLRLLIAEPCNRRPPWRRLFYTHRIVRLGEGLERRGSLTQSAMVRAIHALKEFSTILERHRVLPENIQLVATAAVREAANGPQFCRRVTRETGLRIRIVDGRVEAALTLAGASAVLKPQVRQDMLLFDIGGGSTEFIRAGGGRMKDAVSRKLGVVRLVESHLRSDPPNLRDYESMLRCSREHLKAVNGGWCDGHIPSHLVGTAGTVTTLAAVQMDLFPYDPDRIDNHVIRRDEFLVLRNRLLALTHAERESLPTIEPGRADLIVAGLAILEAILDFWHYEQLTVVDAGLLEGAWLEVAARHSGPACNTDFAV